MQLSVHSVLQAKYQTGNPFDSPWMLFLYFLGQHRAPCDPAHENKGGIDGAVHFQVRRTMKQ